MLRKALKHRAAYFTSKEMDCEVCQSVPEACACIHSRQAQAVIWDVEENGALPALVQARGACRDAFLSILAAPDVSPLAILRPEIAPTSLILHPLTPAEADRTACEILRWACADDGTAQCFVIARRGEQEKIPWEHIYYFESRGKKLYARLRGEEIGFLGTLETLEQTLPENFLRCHRSFIVSVEKIQKVSFSENTILLWDGMSVPVSRGYKQAVKEHIRG